MSNKYFSRLPKIGYNVSGVEYNTVDLSIRFEIIKNLLTGDKISYDYTWVDTDRVDIVAHKYYGDYNLDWLVMMSAEIFDYEFDLPMSYSDFEVFLKTKYGVSDINILKSHVHHYEDKTGVIIDKITYDNLEKLNVKEISIYDYELLKNEAKRNIKLISKKYVNQINNELTDRLNLLTNNREANKIL